jgi:hypothetical protein
MSRLPAMTIFCQYFEDFAVLDGRLGTIVNDRQQVKFRQADDHF